LNFLITTFNEYKLKGKFMKLFELVFVSLMMAIFLLNPVPAFSSCGDSLLQNGKMTGINFKERLQIPIYSEVVSIQHGQIMANFRQIDRSQPFCDVMVPGSSRSGFTIEPGTTFTFKTASDALLGDQVVGARFDVKENATSISVYPAGFDGNSAETLRNYPELLSLSTIAECFGPIATVGAR
jgi:hypothetical protein